MAISDTATFILRRCKTMNCVHEGQSFSAGTVRSELGGHAATATAMKAMVEAQLIDIGANGTFVLTGSGASAISALPPEAKRGHAKAGAWQSRRTADRAS